MLKFACYFDDKHIACPDLRGAYIVGMDGVPARGELHVDGDLIVCESRTQEALGVAVLWPVEGYGTMQLQTTRLPTREKPYNLHVELVRQRLMRMFAKREEWGLFDYPGVDRISEKVDLARATFIKALQNSEDPRVSAKLADQALLLAVQASEELCRFHAEVFVARRRQAGGYPRGIIGVALPPGTQAKALTKKTCEAFDFIQAPFVWRDIQRDERGADFAAVEAWITAAKKAGLAVRGGPVLNFGVQFVPDWMYAKEDDYDAISAYAREHVRKCIQTFGSYIDVWTVAGGLHADNVFSFNFEQIIDLTRTAANTARQTAPHAKIVIDITQPWGEYFARSQRTAPPMLYAEMAVQSGIQFDAFGLQFVFGVDSDGYHPRDLFQISDLIDRFANLGKPLHITAAAVPSDARAVPVADRPWSEELHGDWLADLTTIALSKPYVESVCFQTLSDAACGSIPSGGLLRKDLTPKPAIDRIDAVRSVLTGGGA